MKLLKVILVLSVVTGICSKSIFVQPTFRPTCPYGFVLDRFGTCVEIIEVDRDDYELFLIAKISSVDYDDEPELEPAQADQPAESEDSNRDPDTVYIPEAPPSGRLTLQDSPDLDVMEEGGTFSDELEIMISKDKRSTSPLVEFQTEDNSTESLSTEQSDIYPLTVTEKALENIEPIHEISLFNGNISSGDVEKDLRLTLQTDSLVKQENISAKMSNPNYRSHNIIENGVTQHIEVVSKNQIPNIQDIGGPSQEVIDTDPGNTPLTSFSLQVKNQDNAVTPKHFVVDLNGQKNILKKTSSSSSNGLPKHQASRQSGNNGTATIKTFLISLLNSGRESTNKKSYVESVNDENTNDNIGKSNKIPHNREWRYFKIYGVLRKVVGGRRHKNKT